jgi:hypothetical protein
MDRAMSLLPYIRFVMTKKEVDLFRGLRAAIQPGPLAQDHASYPCISRYGNVSRVHVLIDCVTKM